MRKLVTVMALFVVSLLTLSMVSALDANNLEWGEIEVNGHEVKEGSVLAVEEGQTLKIEVGLEAVAGAQDVEVDAKISGYEYSDYESLEDASHLFDIAAGTTKYVNLEVTLPKKLDKDEYLLRLRVLDKNSAALVNDITLAIEPARHGVDISDVALYPGSTVKAGRTLAAKVLVQNFGDKDQDDVRVKMEMPALGASATPKYIDALTDNHNIEYEDVPEMFLQIPATAAEGDYELKVTVDYDDFRESISKVYTVHVTANEMFQNDGKLVLAVGPETQTVATGKTATYGVALTNAGAASKAYTLEVVAGDWATASVSENLVVLESGKNQVVYVDVTAAGNAPEGAHGASLVVKSGEEVLETVSLNANVVKGTVEKNVSLRNGLEIALIVLVVLIVIIGLIIGFSRLRKDDDEEQTYY